MIQAVYKGIEIEMEMHQQHNLPVAHLIQTATGNGEFATAISVTIGLTPHKSHFLAKILNGVNITHAGTSLRAHASFSAAVAIKAG